MDGSEKEKRKNPSEDDEVFENVKKSKKNRSNRRNKANTSETSQNVTKTNSNEETLIGENESIDMNSSFENEEEVLSDHCTAANNSTKKNKIIKAQVNIQSQDFIDNLPETTRKLHIISESEDHIG